MSGGKSSESLPPAEILQTAVRIDRLILRKRPQRLRDADSVVYCTCPNDKTSRVISRRALAMHFLRIKFLKGGLAGWKAKGYPVARYEKPFQLDTRT
jgi:rhodanese-related sulfurtransferase